MPPGGSGATAGARRLAPRARSKGDVLDLASGGVLDRPRRNHASEANLAPLVTYAKSA